MAQPQLSRRAFMRLTGVAAGTMAIAACTTVAPAPSGEGAGMETVTLNFFNRGGESSSLV